MTLSVAIGTPGRHPCTQEETEFMSDQFRKPFSLRETSVGISDNDTTTRPNKGLSVDTSGMGGVEAERYAGQRGVEWGADGSMVRRSGHASVEIPSDNGLVLLPNGMETDPVSAARYQRGRAPQVQDQQAPQHGEPPVAPSGNSEGAPEATPEATDPDAFTHSEAAVEAVAALGATLPADVQRGAVRRIIGSILETGAEGFSQFADTGRIDALASEHGADGATTRTAATSVFDSMVAQARHLCEKSGVDPSDFYEWARTTQQGQFASAANQQAVGGNMDGWRSLIEKFRGVAQHQSAAAYDAQEILDAEYGAGISVRRDPDNGEIMVHAPGWPPLAWSTAVASGIIKVTKRW